MKREDYDNYVWYPLTDDEYWVEDNKEEFPDCYTIVCKSGLEPLMRKMCWTGWGTMAKDGKWFFMIIERKHD